MCSGQFQLRGLCALFLKFLLSTRMGSYLPAQSIAIGCLISLFYNTIAQKNSHIWCCLWLLLLLLFLRWSLAVRGSLSGQMRKIQYVYSHTKLHGYFSFIEYTCFSYTIFCLWVGLHLLLPVPLYLLSHSELPLFCLS